MHLAGKKKNLIFSAFTVEKNLVLYGRNFSNMEKEFMCWKPKSIIMSTMLFSAHTVEDERKYS